MGREINQDLRSQGDGRSSALPPAACVAPLPLPACVRVCLCCTGWCCYFYDVGKLHPGWGVKGLEGCCVRVHHHTHTHVHPHTHTSLTTVYHTRQSLAHTHTPPS